MIIDNKMIDEKKVQTDRKNYMCHIACNPEVKKRLESNCVRIFKENNPKFQKLNIPLWFILEKVVEYYEET